MAADPAQFVVHVLGGDFTAGVQFGPISTWPPCWLITPITTGFSFGFAFPDVPPTYRK